MDIREERCYKGQQEVELNLTCYDSKEEYVK